MTTQTIEKKTVNISAHISKSLAEKLEKVARFEERGKSYYIKKSLEQYLEQKLEDMEDYIDGEEAWEDMQRNGRKGIPWEDVQKELDLLDKSSK